jgi:hypothetical protein
MVGSLSEQLFVFIYVFNSETHVYIFEHAFSSSLLDLSTFLPKEALEGSRIIFATNSFAEARTKQIPAPAIPVQRRVTILQHTRNQSYSEFWQQAFLSTR